ncbi:MAG: SDR family oxidoreductase [Sideroxydans sp.]|nr:SDR family oxidoreductase [Sideroxydans sp.]
MKRLLLIGCGDISLRTISLLQGHYRLYGLVRNPAKAAQLRTLGVTPIMGNLDEVRSLSRLTGIADVVLHFAPPPVGADTDSRTRHLLAALSGNTSPKKFIYISTSGVYGDCQGNIVSETHPLNAQTPRGKLRIDAEQQIRTWAQRNQVRAHLLRVPGIYAAERLPLERLRNGTPAINVAEDGYSNHIHADDLARIVVAALRHGKPNRVYHTVDDDQMKMGDYFDTLADAFKLPRPTRLSRAEVQRTVSPMMWSFMNESRRLTNIRMKQELKVRLRYPDVRSALTVR